MLAAIRDTPYKIVLLLHILAVIVAFAPATAHALQTVQSRNAEPAVRGKMLGYMVANGKKVYAPAVIVVGLLGMALVGMSDSGFSFGDTWVSLSFLGWIAMNGVLHGLVMPNERRLAAGDSAAEGKVNLGGGIVSILLVVMVILMIWKPGS